MTTKHTVSPDGTDIFLPARDCWNLFEKIVNQAHTDIPLLWRVVNDYQQRYRSWTGFLGVFAEGNLSLDHRLRNSEDVKSLVLHQLRVAKRNLNATLEFLKVNKDTVIDTSASSEDLKGLHPVMKAMLSGVQSALERLNQLGFAIRHASAGQLMSRVQPLSSDPDAGSFEILVHTIAETLYPDASLGLLERISCSLARKYQLIRNKQGREEMYRVFPWEENRNFSSRQPNFQNNARKSTENVHERLATGNRSPLGDDFGSTPPPPTSSKFSQSMFNKIYKPSASGQYEASKTPTSARTGFAKYFPPQIIPEGESQPLCTWCFEPHPLAMYKTPEKWRTHVERDWKPYVCISETCTQLDPVPSFPKVSAWKEHMELKHSLTWSQRSYRQSTWVCDLDHESSTDTTEEFSTEAAFEEHMKKHEEFALPEVQAMAKYCIVQLDRAANICPLCTRSIDEDIRTKGTREGTTADNDLSLGASNTMVSPTANIGHQAEADRSKGESDMTPTPLQTSDRMAMHVASHLQNITFIALRFLCLPPSTGDESGDSASVNVDDEESDPADANFSDYQQRSGKENHQSILDNIFGLLKNIMGITSGLIDAFPTIMRIKGVPHVFEFVSNELPLLQERLRKIHQKFQDDDLNIDYIGESMFNYTLTLMECEAKLEHLSTVIRELESKCNDSQESPTFWNEGFRRIYREALLRTPAERVETSMLGILRDLTHLASPEIVHMEHAIDFSVDSILELEEAQSSLNESDSDKEETNFEGAGDDPEASEDGSDPRKARRRNDYRVMLRKIFERSSSSSGKSRLSVPSILKFGSGRFGRIKSDANLTSSTGSVVDLPLRKPLLPRATSTRDKSGATFATETHVTLMWSEALGAILQDEECSGVIKEFTSLLNDYMAHEQFGAKEPMSSSEHELRSIEDALSLVDGILQNATKIQKAMDNTLGIFNVARGLGSFVRSMLSKSEPAALAWSALCACIPIMVAPTEQPRSMIKGLRYIYGQAPVYFDLTGNLLQAEVASSESGNSFRTNFQPLYEGILKYVMLSICSIHDASFGRFQKAIRGQVQWETLLDNIKAAETISVRDTRSTHDSKLLAVKGNLEDNYTRSTERGEDQRRRDFLCKLKGMDYEARLNTTRTRLDGTCQWFRQHPGFRDWLISSGGLLLVSASAGCGKSVLSKYLIEELLREEYGDATICYFFFKESDPQARSFLNASKAILHRFLESNPTLVDACMEHLPSNPNDLSESEFTDVWSVFRQQSKNCSARKTVCVLDALDESDPHQRSNFLSCLKDHVIDNNGTSQVKFIVTTRGYPQIVNLFSAFSSNKVHLDGDSREEKRQIQAEISIVMNHRLKELRTTMPDISDDTLEIIRTGLSANGEGQRTYLWMHLMLDYIHKNRFCTREEWRELFGNPPDTVDKAYERLLQGVTPQANEKVRTLLALILAAKRPLTIGELSIAVNCRISVLNSRQLNVSGISKQKEKEFGSWIGWECGSFVTLYDGKAFLIHQTAKEFLLETMETNDESRQGSMTEHAIHQYMAESCISFLSFEMSQQQPYIGNAQREIPGRLDDGDYPLASFLVYSATNWMSHFRKCQQSDLPDGQVSDVGEGFFQLYLGLFVQEFAGSYRIRDDWRQQAWYSILMASRPVEVFPRLLIYNLEDGCQPLVPEFFTVPNLACLFDHRRLLMIALDVTANITNPTQEDYGFRASNTNSAPSLPHFAAYGRSPQCLSYLRNRGYNINVQDSDGQTPLHKAMLHGDTQTIATLLELGASKTSLDHCDRTPLTWGMIIDCSWVKDYILCVKENESEIRSLFHYAAIAGRPSTVGGFSDEEIQRLARSSHNPDDEYTNEKLREMRYLTRSHSPFLMLHDVLGSREFSSDNVVTAMHLSVESKKSIHNTQCLVEWFSWSLNRVNNSGNTPLHTAILAKNVAAAVFLLCGRPGEADRNRKGARGDTALHMACKIGHVKAAEFLMNAGVGIEIRNDDGLTALDLDRPPRLGVGLLELILRRGADPINKRPVRFPDLF